ncbi:uncharacterized protein LOC127280610 isoform X2 [Leptopilina boulardi]|nr:uncharacterized protein LOC127280610 isoform X2 [Leptopilina boulardi]XP_051159708.1 uncharacterized protein LOC127280610 isoform X2 [Leptopilina boulardi]
MQVLLHAVEQLKQLHLDGSEYNTNILISSSPHPPGLTTWQIVSKIGNDMELTTSSYNVSSHKQMKNDMIKITPNYKENTSSLLDKLNNNKTININELMESKSNKNKEIYGIVKPSKERVTEFTDEFENLDEHKSDEIRIDLSGKRSASLQQLASLYDALNKDARGQGFVIYTGFSDEVIKTLSSSIKAGIGFQLKKILEKSLERGELTRDNSKIQAQKTINDLKDTKSYLSTDLRRLLPLRYVQ